MIVNEVFGPTFQGEGPRLGRRCAFVRLMACNLSCSWCDTPYTWDAKRYNLRDESTNMTPAEIALQVDEMGVADLVVSGGEPLLHQKRADWNEFMKVMSDAYHITVETNGTIVPNTDSLHGVSVFSVSPKLSHSSDSWQKRIVPPALTAFSALAAVDRAYFKFVARSPTDLDEVADIVHAYDIPFDNVWIMPEGTDTEAINGHAAKLADEVLQRGYHMTTRLHVLTWGNRRGV